MPKSSVILASFRGIRVASHIARGLFLCCFFPILKEDSQKRILNRWSCRLMDILNVRIELHGSNSLPSKIGCLIVANHISWLDVIAINAVTPSCFVAKSEIRNWPLLGWLCYQAGTLFIKRGVRRDSVRINHKISGMLQQGGQIALFPEGTSSDDGFPGHFHSSLLQGAIDSGAEIRPLAIRYHDKSGKINSDAAYVGDMSFIESLWKILRSPSLHVTLFYLPAVSCADRNRRWLASETHTSICTALANFSPNRSACTLNSTPQLKLDSVELPSPG